MNHFYKQLDNIRGQGSVPVIVDMKRISPKDGELIPEGEAAAYALRMKAAGATVFSVVTESEHFGGSLDMMEQICRETGCPVLRKDFISTEDHLKETVAAGASAILLISSQMDQKTLYMLYERSLDLGLDPLVEVHTKEELDTALKLKPEILGINNRNISILEKDNGTVNTSELLLPEVPDNILTISESAIARQEDVERAVKAGAKAVLVGTAIWKAADPEAFYQTLCVRR